MNATTALIMVAKTEFKPFTISDYEAFSGVTSEYPMIGEYEDYIIVIDGDVIQITECELGSCYQFNLGEALRIF
jgi:hypothetical protein